ncbi:hypothetical protein ACWDV4_23360 [Micromonospora sp. NPDC003197]
MTAIQSPERRLGGADGWMRRTGAAKGSYGGVVVEDADCSAGDHGVAGAKGGSAVVPCGGTENGCGAADMDCGGAETDDGGADIGCGGADTG